MTDGSPVSLASAGRSAVILAAGTLVAQATIVVRELFLAAQVGLTADLDALLIGITLPVAIAGVLTAGLTTALVPAYISAASRTGFDDARRLAGTVLVWVGIGALVLWGLLSVFASQVVSLTGFGLGLEDQASAAGYMRVVAPIVLSTSLTAILLAVCQAEQHFVPIAVSTVGTAATSMILLVVLWDPLGLSAYAVSSLLGPFVGLVVAVVATWRRSIIPKPGLFARGLGLSDLIRHAFPLTVSAAVLQVTVVANRAVASLLGPGAVSAVRYGELLINVPIGAIAPSWGSAIYPALVRSTQAAEAATLANAVTRALRFAVTVFAPVAGLVAAMAPLIVSIAYGRGAVTEDQLAMTARVVLGFAPMIVIAMAIPVLTGGLNARRKGTTLLAAGMLNVASNLGLSLLLGSTLGAPGIAVATSVANGLATVFLAWRFARIEGGFRPSSSARALAVSALSITPALVAVGLLTWLAAPSDDVLVDVLLLGMGALFGLASYVVIASRLGLTEVRELSEALTSAMPMVRTNWRSSR